MPQEKPPEFGTQQFEYSRRDRIYLILTLIGCLLILVAAGLYVGYKLEQQSLNSLKPDSAVNVTTIPITNTYLGWHTYTDSIYHYSFKYPSNWVLQSSSNEKDVNTPSIVTFTTPDGFIFTFGYNTKETYPVQQFVVYKSVLIDSKQFTKLFINNCKTTTNANCRLQFTGIVYDMQPDFTSNSNAFLSSTGNTINGKTLYLDLDLNGRSMQLNYPSFNNTNTSLDQLIQSIKLPTI